MSNINDLVLDRMNSEYLDEGLAAAIGSGLAKAGKAAGKAIDNKAKQSSKYMSKHPKLQKCIGGVCKAVMVAPVPGSAAVGAAGNYFNNRRETIRTVNHMRHKARDLSYKYGPSLYNVGRSVGAA